MLSDKIVAIEIADAVAEWKAAIVKSAQPLLEKAYITREYVEAMIQNVEDNGTYIIIVPGFAMPHARPECGVNKSGIALLKLRQPVAFPDGQEVSVMMALAACDSEEHLETISALSEVLMDDQVMDALFQATTVEEISECLKS